MRKFTIFWILIAAVAVTSVSPAKEISLEDRVAQMGPDARKRLKPWFLRNRVSYPPAQVAFVTIKDENRLKVYAADDSDDWKFVVQYQVAKLSGGPGPKLRAGDKQVPEGIYNITYANPASKYWLSLALNYPNEFDRRQARREGRTRLGSDIMIHGWWFSTGCVAVGNTAAEDLFILAHDVGINNTKVVITPTDFRHNSPDTADLPTKPAWVTTLYDQLADELNTYGSDGMSTESRLIAYNDLAPPPPPEPTTTFGKIIRALANAAAEEKD